MSEATAMKRATATRIMMIPADEMEAVRDQIKKVAERARKESPRTAVPGDFCWAEIYREITEIEFEPPPPGSADDLIWTVEASGTARALAELAYDLIWRHSNRIEDLVNPAGLPEPSARFDAAEVHRLINRMNTWRGEIERLDSHARI